MTPIKDRPALVLRYIAHRLLVALALLFPITAAIFALLALMPGDQLSAMAGATPDMTPEDVARLRELWGLDGSIPERYGRWLLQVVQGNLGDSNLHSRPVAEVIGPAVIRTLLLAGSALVIAVAIALVLGVISAARPGGVIDGGISLFAFAGMAMPPFYLAILLILLFPITLGLFSSDAILTDPDAGLAERLNAWALPLIVLILATIGQYLRFVRGAMLEETARDYLRTARVKGASRARVLWRHALPNALLPIVTVVALGFGTLLSGALVVEQIFALDGMGKLLFDAVNGDDHALALGAFLMTTVTILLSALVADLLYVALDPRIRLEGGA